MEATTIEGTVPQHMEALALANRIRFAQVNARREIKAGKLSLADALEHPDLQREKLWRVLEAQPRWGRARMARLLYRINMPSSALQRRIESLTPRQRDLLARGAADRTFMSIR